MIRPTEFTLNQLTNSNQSQFRKANFPNWFENRPNPGSTCPASTVQTVGPPKTSQTSTDVYYYDLEQYLVYFKHISSI